MLIDADITDNTLHHSLPPRSVVCFLHRAFTAPTAMQFATDPVFALVLTISGTVARHTLKQVYLASVHSH